MVDSAASLRYCISVGGREPPTPPKELPATTPIAPHHAEQIRRNFYDHEIPAITAALLGGEDLLARPEAYTAKRRSALIVIVNERSGIWS